MIKEDDSISMLRLDAFCTFGIETKHMKCIRLKDGVMAFCLKVHRPTEKDEYEMESLIRYGLVMMVE